MRRLRAIFLILVLVLAGCQDERQRTAFCENEGVCLMVGGSIAFDYEPNSCQLAFSRDRREFRAFTDTMSDFFVAELSALPVEMGQRLTANLVWTTEREVLSRKNLTLEVVRLEGDTVWLWSDAGRIGLTVRILE